MRICYFIRLAILLFPLNFIYTFCLAQKPSINEREVIAVLSDTLNPELHLIPLKIKSQSHNANILIGYYTVLNLYEYFKERFDWSREVFAKKISYYIIKDQPYETNDTSILSMNTYIPISECNCLYNEDSEILKQRIIIGNYYKYPDNRFSCFVYKCLRQNIFLSSIEGHIVFKNR